MQKPIGGTVTLGAGIAMPRVGLGVFRSGNGAGTRDAVRAALAAGYRHIDTAAIYRNEAEVGEAIRAWCDETGIARAEIFVTTKLWNEDHGYDEALRAFDRSTAALGVGTIDLYLLHWPVSGKRLESWRALERLLADGRVRAIGVSNFTIRHLEELLRVSGTVPSVNQVEFSPFLYQRELLQFCAGKGIRLVAYCPLTRGDKLKHPLLVTLGRKHGKTAAQVMLRWALQHGVGVIPKSVRTERIDENAALFDFALSDADMADLDRLDEGYRTCWDPSRVR